jgi:phenylacetate-CoA ligase
MVKNFLIRNLIFKNRIGLIPEKKSLYNGSKSKKDIYDYQLRAFNNQWSKIIKENKFYKFWTEANKLPNQIDGLEDLSNFPVLTKKVIQKHSDLIFSNLSNNQFVITGGSTGEPTKFPTSKVEQINNYANAYLGRSWFGVSPLDEILLIWGHSHLFGTGIIGQFNNIKRIIYDSLINTRRLNAYDMSIDTLNKYYLILLKSNPVLIIGYTSVIYKLAKFIKENNLIIGDKSNLKGIVVTSETVTKLDVDLIEEIFQVQCIIEYGMAETGVLSYTQKSNRSMKFFWDSFIGTKDHNNILHITTIHEKAFPLINYRTDDLITTNDNISIINISSINGRSKEILTVFLSGRLIEISGILIIHALKSFKGIYEIKFSQKNEGKINVDFTANNKIDIRKVSNYFIENLRIDYSKIDSSCFIFTQVDFIPKTISGKEKIIVKN